MVSMFIVTIGHELKKMKTSDTYVMYDVACYIYNAM